MSRKSHNPMIIIGLIIIVVSFAFAGTNSVLFVSMLVLGGAVVYFGRKQLDE